MTMIRNALAAGAVMASALIIPATMPTSSAVAGTVTVTTPAGASSVLKPCREHKDPERCRARREYRREHGRHHRHEHGREERRRHEGMNEYKGERRREGMSEYKGERRREGMSERTGTGRGAGVGGDISDSVGGSGTGRGVNN